MIQWQVVALLFGAMAFLSLTFGDSLKQHALWAGWCVGVLLLSGKRKARNKRRAARERREVRLVGSQSAA
ncbi:hypothetical protein PLANPX_1943 [Lacipirellula parvula]|uniref:Uncharacterized protein n=1 Tax=Lacipirellula parvula TaxID=2650471 RepID=A0A5K7XBU7_9BACT|nr:hypothetical protein PLANPX_1943 [Lacipirellula parvula]